MNNQECKIELKVIDTSNIEPSFYPYSIEVNKYSDSCSKINDPYTNFFVPDIFKNINVKVFNKN